MGSVLRILGWAAVALPFVLIYWLTCRTRRNEGSQHGGGLQRWWQIRR